jgi:hypothetical protein
MINAAVLHMLYTVRWSLLSVAYQVISWWGPSWREGTHDTQGVNTDAVLGVVIRELEQQDKVKLAFHMEPYEGAHLSSLLPAPPAFGTVSGCLVCACGN